MKTAIDVLNIGELEKNDYGVTFTDVKVEETKSENDGLYLELMVTVKSTGVTKVVEDKITEANKTFAMAGFREGRVPLSIARKKIGPEILAKAIEEVVDFTLKMIYADRKMRPAMQPMVDIKSFDDKTGLVYEVKFECFPETPELDYSKISVEQLVIEILPEDLKKAHEDILNNFKNFNPVSDMDYVAKMGDAVIIDFTGTIDGEEFDGGSATDLRLELGSGQFIAGFEEQLVGCKVGDEKTFNITFPHNYMNPKVSNKEAKFTVKIKEILTPETIDNINDEFAKKMGVDDLETLNKLIEMKIENDFNNISRLRTKKMLFDQIDAVYRFPIPKNMVSTDFEAMLAEIKSQMAKNPSAPKKTDKELRDEYYAIAERRVRLGVLLAEIARRENIEVTEEELQQAVYTEAMQKPGQEKMIIDFYAKKENLEKLRGPLLEEKVVDFILTKVSVITSTVTTKEFVENHAQDLTLPGMVPPTAGGTAAA